MVCVIITCDQGYFVSKGSFYCIYLSNTIIVYNLQFDLEVKCEHEDSKYTWLSAYSSFISCKMVVIVKGEPFVVEKFLNDERFSALRINASILGHVLGRSLGQISYSKESLITSPQIRFADIKARNLIYIVLMLDDNWDKTFYTLL